MSIQALMVAAHGADLAGPRLGDDQIAGRLHLFNDFAGAVHQGRLHAEERPCGAARLQRRGARSGAIMMPPVSVCHQVSTMGQRPSPTTW